MRSTWLLLVLLLAPGCPTPVMEPSPTPTPVVDAGGEPQDAGFATSTRQALRWKRHRTLQNDLARALALEPDEVCREVGGRACATTGPVLLTDLLVAGGVQNVQATCAAVQRRANCVDGPILELQTPKGIHVSALGGNEPFLGESFTPLAEPLLTTPLAVDRFVLEACGTRAERDARGPAVVFTRFSLTAEVSAGAPGVREQTADLFRRLLAREASATEVDAIVSMLDAAPMGGRQFAQLSCFAIATTTEFLFQ